MSQISTKKFITGGVLIAAILAGGVSYYASSSPDGLEKVAGDIGFIESAKDSAVADSTLAEYGVKGVENERISGGLAGLIGIAGTGILGGGLFWFLRRKPTNANKK